MTQHSSIIVVEECKAACTAFAVAGGSLLAIQKISTLTMSLWAAAIRQEPAGPLRYAPVSCRHPSLAAALLIVKVVFSDRPQAIEREATNPPKKKKYYLSAISREAITQSAHSIPCCQYEGSRYQQSGAFELQS